MNKGKNAVYITLPLAIAPMSAAQRVKEGRILSTVRDKN